MMMAAFVAATTLMFFATFCASTLLIVCLWNSRHEEDRGMFLISSWSAGASFALTAWGAAILVASSQIH